MKLSSFLGSLALAVSAVTASAATYNGNGGTGFGGNVGNGILTVTSNASAGTVTFSEAASGGNFGGNALVLYIDSVAGGFANTSTFTDNNDGERVAVSGYNLNNANNNNTTSQTVATFASGFAADYAIAFDANNANAYSLVSNGTFPFILNAAQTGANPFAITLTLSSLGLTPTSSFKFVGSLISETAFRSNESIGTITPSAANGGFNGAITYTNFNTFAVPEPGTMAFAGLGAVALAGLAWRRKGSQA